MAMAIGGRTSPMRARLMGYSRLCNRPRGVARGIRRSFRSEPRWCRPPRAGLLGAGDRAPPGSAPAVHAAGRVKGNDESSPGVDSTRTVPPRRSTIRLTIARPMPSAPRRGSVAEPLPDLQPLRTSGRSRPASGPVGGAAQAVRPNGSIPGMTASRGSGSADTVLREYRCGIMRRYKCIV
jgi:hypothetical protein